MNPASPARIMLPYEEKPGWSIRAGFIIGSGRLIGNSASISLARGAVRERMLFNRLAEDSIRLPPYPEQLRASKALATLKPIKCAIQKQLHELNKIPERMLSQAFEIK